MESLLTAVANYLARQSWQVSVVFLFVAAACYFLRRASAHWRYLLWLIVLAKCMTPPIINMPLAVLPPPAEAQITPERLSSPAAMAGPPHARLPAALAAPEPAAAAATLPTVVVAENLSENRNRAAITSNGNQDSRAGSKTAPQEMAGTSAIPAVAKAPAVRTIDPPAWAAAVWALGVAIFIGYALAKACSTNRRLAQTRLAADPRIAAKVAALAQRMGMKTVPSVYLVKAVGQPFVWGWFRGSIYLPPHFLETGTSEQQETILRTSWPTLPAGMPPRIWARSWCKPCFSSIRWCGGRTGKSGDSQNCCDETVIAGLGADPRLYGQAIVDTLVAEYEANQAAPSLAVTGGLKNVEGVALRRSSVPTASSFAGLRGWPS